MTSPSRRFQTTAAQSLFIVFALVFAAHAQGKLEKVAVNLHDNWFVQSSAKVTDTGAVISAPGYHSGNVSRTWRFLRRRLLRQFSGRGSWVSDGHNKERPPLTLGD